MKSKFLIALVFLPLTLSYADPISRTFTQHGITLTAELNSDTIDLASDTELSFTLSSPQGISSKIPPNLADRFEGFTISGSYSESAPTDISQGETTTYRYQLTPIAGAPRYCIRPFPVTTENSSTHPTTTSWFATERIEIAPPTQPDDVPNSVLTNLESKYIRPSFESLPQILGYTVLAIAGIALASFIFSKIRLRQKIRRMAPDERAYFELNKLLSRHLPEKGLFKDFYVELTMVVRRYIERRHGIRAPEQTTEEFLAAAINHHAFDSSSFDELKRFLTSADLIKFAGVTATLESTQDATSKAQTYIKNDSAKPVEKTEAAQ